ncbi:MAG TPA: GxxExxY protein [Arenimonas sp.]|uniref:GxxExxY protein n=1 Tax=Arenimonas sp. TaxID=1872635 RepID=UPI002D7F2E9C|nr:GxxExxY protein [Arenimonas sp.]HEU0152371.1 GxxExxY protein [Arenimonas sp.]
MGADNSGLMQEGITEIVIRSFYAVYNELGTGFLEQVYENALSFCLKEAGLPVWQQVAVDVFFRDHKVGDYRVDLLIPDKVLIEIKVASTISPAHEAQLVNYLKATGIPVGLLLNFGPRPQVKRRVHSASNPPLSAPTRSYPR